MCTSKFLSIEYLNYLDKYKMKASIIISIIRTYISIELITFFNFRQTVNFNRQIDHLNKIFLRQAR